MELLTWRNIKTGNGTTMLQKKTGPAATDFALYVEKAPKPKENISHENCFMVRIGRRTLIDKKKFQKWIDRQS